MPITWYRSRLARQPLLTQTITTAVLFATGDVLAQQAVDKVGVDRHDFKRTGRMTLYGGAFFGPAATLWYRLLSHRVNLANKPKTAILARVGLDQIVFTPLNLTAFLSYMACMEGVSVRKRLADAWWPVFRTNLCLWPWVQMANFGLVPLEHRVLVVNVVALGWNCYLSYMNSSKG